MTTIAAAGSSAGKKCASPVTTTTFLAMSAYVDTAAKVKSAGMVDFLLKLIPSTVMGAFASGDVLQVLLVSILFGCALSLVGERGQPLVTIIDTRS